MISFKINLYVRAQKNAKLPMIPKREITYNKIIWDITDLVALIQ